MPAERPSLGEMVVISLDRTPERWAAFQAAHAGLTYTRFPAVDGERLDRDMLVAKGLMQADLGYSAAASGCALSHAALWRRSVETQAPLTICEDDARLRPDFASAAEAALATTPEADIVLWGWNFDSVLAGR